MSWREPCQKAFARSAEPSLIQSTEAFGAVVVPVFLFASALDRNQRTGHCLFDQCFFQWLNVYALEAVASNVAAGNLASVWLFHWADVLWQLLRRSIFRFVDSISSLLLRIRNIQR